MDVTSIESPERVFNTWIHEKCNENEMVIVNSIPFLADDCIEFLKGNIISAQNNNSNQLIVKTEDDMNYILEEFS